MSDKPDTLEQAIEDLLDVPGIGEAKLVLLRPGVSAP